ncbi:hypothetical protein AB0K51_26205 [Kitasatospora sp. NPDC049285]|uniref:hypothetical protein n=1 Tax=Kitasatospora sp. NPDC049285 TaxID=3157096 RepID=UPI003441BB0C
MRAAATVLRPAGPVATRPAATRPLGQLADSVGEFTFAGSCGRIRRTVDSAPRYDAIARLLTDHVRGEPLSQALAARGPAALTGYAEAIARATDEVLLCGCGRVGHEQAAEAAMGACLWHVLAPSPAILVQLHARAADDSPTRTAYRHRPAHTRLRAAAATVLRPGHLLHHPDGHPLWSTRPAPPGGPAEQLARRATRRTLGARIPDTDHARTVKALAESVLTDCDWAADSRALRSLGSRWRELFDAATATAPDLGTSHDELRDLLTRTWHAVTAEPDPTLLPDTDQALRRTHRLPAASGRTLHRAFLGLATTMIELTGLGPYTRATEGTAAVHRASHG